MRQTISPIVFAPDEGHIRQTISPRVFVPDEGHIRQTISPRVFVPGKGYITQTISPRVFVQGEGYVTQTISPRVFVPGEGYIRQTISTRVFVPGEGHIRQTISPRVFVPCEGYITQTISPRVFVPDEGHIRQTISPRVFVPGEGYIRQTISPRVFVPDEGHIRQTISPIVFVPDEGYITQTISPIVFVPDEGYITQTISPREFVPGKGYITQTISPRVFVQGEGYVTQTISPRVFVPGEGYIRQTISPRVFVPDEGHIRQTISPRVFVPGEGYFTQSRHVMWMLPTIILFFTTICCWKSGRCRRTSNRWCAWLIERVPRSLWTGRNPLPQVTTGESDIQDSTDPSQGGSDTDQMLPGAKPTSSTHATPSQADHDLYYASSDGDLEAVERILSAGHVDINNRGEWSRTPVMAAAWRGHRDVVEILVSRGADVSLVDDSGYNVLHYACVGGDRETVEFVLSLDGVDINSRGGGSWKPVMWAAREGHRYVVELLVSRGADVSLVDDVGNNILHYTCVGGDRETGEFVLSLDGVDINSRGERSRTPVMEAAREGHRDVVELLVSRGADVSLVDDDGDNILHYACGGGDRKTVELVLSLDGVDINARNNIGQTTADVARGWRHHQLSDLLVSRGGH
ncbi:uncharacterized protein LOC124253782 isoform X8 [Haliotis rubra]|uniref:uncharacterized protein LOC124253782 isoform X8 n=1 Tax=Haliotis rubra TaxID=36100 RepID=UPI001EE62FFF|nr:uncharacterized protein LOC124253782 isoform X8 [Haliotis rubra]